MRLGAGKGVEMRGEEEHRTVGRVSVTASEERAEEVRCVGDEDHLGER